MKKIKVEKRRFTKIAALVVGIILWIILINVENADFTVRRKDIPVQITGESLLEERSLVVSNKEDVGEASISLRGKRSDVINYMGEVYATADVSKITDPGEYNVKLNYESPSNTLYITERETSTVKVIVEKLDKKEVDVIVIRKNEPAASGTIIESVPAVKKVVISGTAADLEQIAFAAVTVDVRSVAADSRQWLDIVPVDENNKALTFTNSIFLELDETEVINKVYNRLTLPVIPEVRTAGSEAFIIEELSLEEIDVGVAEGVTIENVKAIIEYTANAGEEYSVELQGGEGVYIPREYKNVMVKLRAVPKLNDSLAVPLEVAGASGKKVSVPEEVIIEVSGAGEELLPENITATVDVSELEAGTHDIQVEVEFKKTSLQLVKAPKATVVIE